MTVLQLPETEERHGCAVEVTVDPGGPETAEECKRGPAVRLWVYFGDGSRCLLRFDALEAGGLAEMMAAAAEVVARMTHAEIL